MVGTVPDIGSSQAEQRTEVCTTNKGESGCTAETALLDQVWAFVEAGQEELEVVVQACPELLTPEALNLLEGLTFIARDEGDEAEAVRLAERLGQLGGFLRDRGSVFRM